LCYQSFIVVNKKNGECTPYLCWSLNGKNGDKMKKKKNEGRGKLKHVINDVMRREVRLERKKMRSNRKFIYDNKRNANNNALF